MSLAFLARRLSRAIPSALPQSSNLRRSVPISFQRLFNSSPATFGANDTYPWETTEDKEIDDGSASLDPPGTPWIPAPVAEDYEATIMVLLNGQKVEDALDIFARMVKRGFHPSKEVIDSLYATTKEKPEWKAAAVQTIKSLDLSSLK